MERWRRVGSVAVEHRRAGLGTLSRARVRYGPVIYGRKIDVVRLGLVAYGWVILREVGYAMPTYAVLR
jgi:hypothetical protein